MTQCVIYLNFYLIAYRSILLSASGIIYAEAYLDIILTTEEFHFEFDSELFLKKHPVLP